ncbi:MAG: beta-lactamase-like protein [Polyangiaceae bacterium]|jgi:CubicO group peptidase (beta-lactamase class C family)|nr:beta-lactamase-like protein [Polyangiaceae bacterium]
MTLLPLLFVVGCSPEGEPTEPSEALSSTQVATIEAAASKRLGQGSATSYSIAVWRDGKVIYEAAFGAKDEEGNAATKDTLFQIGSDTKKLTALGVLQQVQAGTLALSQTVADAVPGLALASKPDHFESVTLHDLLSQRTGLYDYTPWVDRPADAELSGVAFGMFAQKEPVMMPAGIAFNYSNPNYSLAGLAHEIAASKPWADAIDEEVFEKLEMRHSYARRDDMLARESDIASGYGPLISGDWDPFQLPEDGAMPEPQEGWVTPENQPDDAFTRPAGLVWSTAGDQARLLGFLVDGNPAVLSNDLRERLVTPHSPWYNHVDSRGYGYGVVVDRFSQGPDQRFYPLPSYSHGGATLTMTSSSAALPEQRVAVSILSNGALEDLEGLTTLVLEVASEGRLPAPFTPEGPPEPADLESYAGTYTEPMVGDVTLTWENGALSVDIPALNELDVPYEREPVPVARDLFLFSIDSEVYPISFYDDPDGTAHRYGVHREFVLTRVVP